MEELISYRHELLSALEDDMRVITEAESRLTAQDWHHQPDGSPFSPHFILAHVRALDTMEFNDQIQHILTEEMPLLALFNDQAWMADHYQPGEPVNQIVEEISHVRQQEVILLRSLLPDSWSRTARHPWWGIHTLQWWVELQRDYTHQLLMQVPSILGL